MPIISSQQFNTMARGYSRDPSNSYTINSEAYTQRQWFDVEQQAIFKRSWIWACHVEKLAQNSSYFTTEIFDQPIVLLRDKEGELKAFYNVCKHRAHQLIEGEGKTNRLTCPYHAWTYALNGQLLRAPNTQHLQNFEPSRICLEAIQVEEFCGFIYINLDPNAPSLAVQSGNLADEINHWVPDIKDLTLGHRLNYEIDTNWKNVIDNFLECYHCRVAHKDFCELVDMDTYQVTTHEIYSSHMADAGNTENSAYDVSQAEVKTHAVWWLWPTTCLMHYPGRNAIIVLNVIPVSPVKTLETYDFYLPDDQPNQAELEAIDYIDKVLQVEDINLVESVQRGMSTPAFKQGRIVYDPSNSSLSEHAVHHFHGLILDSYSWASKQQ